MTWTLVHLANASIGAVEEYRTSYLYDASPSSAYGAMSGTHAWSITGRSSGIGANVMGGVSVRAGYWAKRMQQVNLSGIEGFDNFIFFYGRSTTDNDPVFSIYYNGDTRRMHYTTYDVAGNPTDNPWPLNADAVEILYGSATLWSHFGLSVNYTTGYISMYWNGAQVLTFATAGLPALGYLYCASWSGLVGGYATIDDVYFQVSDADETDACPPAKRFYPTVPNAPGTFTFFTPAGAAANWQCVDETPADYDDSYVYTDAEGTRDTYAFTNASTLPPTSAIYGVVLQALVRLFPSADVPGQFRLVRDQGGHIDLSDAIHPIREGWISPLQIETTRLWSVLMKYYAAQWDSSPWTEADFDAAEWGIDTIDSLNL